MAETLRKNFGTPDETREIPNAKVAILKVGDMTVARGTFQPGWRWSEHVKPIVGTATCQVRHEGTVESGRLHISMEGGNEVDLGPGDAYVIPPGHDAWVVGDEPVVSYDFTGGPNYAKPA